MNILRYILLPLMVMLLLTVLAGSMSFHLTSSWEESVRESHRQLIKSLILNNVQADIRQLKQADASDAQKRRITHKVQQQLQLLKNDMGISGLPAFLEAFLKTDPSPEVLVHIPEQDLITLDLGSLERLLKAQHDSSWSASLITTLIMLGLGVVLMLLTARDLSRLFDQLVRSRDMNVRIQEHERRRIAQDLHDSVIQELVVLRRNYRADGIDTLIETIRGICLALKPQMLQDIGLAAGIESLALTLQHNTGMRVQTDLEETLLDALPENDTLAIYRIIQELLNNIQKHSSAQQVCVWLGARPQGDATLLIRVQDDGIGFDPASAVRPGSLGLVGIEERVRQCNGTLRIHAAPGQGTQVEVIIPISPTVKQAA